MNNETLNQVFSSTANSIRTKTGTSASIAPINFANSILNIPGATPQDIYKVASIQERDNLNAKEGDIALVYNKSNKIMNKNYTEITTVTFPETVVLESQISGFADLSLRPPEAWEPEVRVSSSGGNEVEVTIMAGSEYYYFTYTSQDGLNFTISGDYPVDRVFTTETPIGTDPDIWEQYNSEPLAPFIYVDGIDFDGIFTYKDSSWDNLAIGIHLNPIELLEGNTAYTSKGKISGSYFGNNSIKDTVYATSQYLFKLPNYTVNMTDMSNLFSGNTNGFDISIFNYINTDSVTNISGIFNGCTRLTYIPNFNTINVTNASHAFTQMHSVNQIPNFNFSNVVDMSYCFTGISGLTSIPNFNTVNVTSMFYTFGSCFNLSSIPNLDTSNCENFGDTFFACFSLIDAPNLNVSKCKNAFEMFGRCDNTVNIPPLYMPECTNAQSMFNYCNKLSNASISNIFNTCINMTKISNKTLKYLGFNSNAYPASKIQAQPGYQNFVNAGWSIGY